MNTETSVPYAANEPSQRVVVTGIGIVSALGLGNCAFWNGLVAGSRPFTLRYDWDIPDIGGQWIGKIPGFSVKDYLPGITLPHPNRHSQLALVASSLALKDSGLNTAQIDPMRIGTVLSTDFASNESVEQYLIDLLTKGPNKVSPILFSRTVANVATGDIARFFKLKGVNSLLIGENSVAYAFDLLADGAADVILCGGVDEVRYPIYWVYNNFHLLSDATRELDITHPYSKHTKGMMLGEGAAILTLELLSHALERGANIYAEVFGYHTICDRSANYLLHERNVDDLCFTMSTAMAEASLPLDLIGCVFGCASSHPQISNTELQACNALWKESNVLLTSIKGAIGETFGSSGALNISAAALAVSKGIAPSCGDFVVHSGSRHVTLIDKNPALIPLSSPVCICNSIHIGGNITSILIGPCCFANG